jgi:hypothetical protein
MLDEIFNKNIFSYLSMDINLLHNEKLHIYILLKVSYGKKS